MSKNPNPRIDIALKDIKSNPFQKFIQGGRLEQGTLQSIRDGASRSTLRENLTVRQTEHGYELIGGHHRLAVAKELFGLNAKISAEVVHYTDTQMLASLIGDNNESSNPQRKQDSIVATHEYLKAHPEACKTVSTGDQSKLKSEGGRPHVHGSTRCVSEFLGTSDWPQQTVAEYFQMAGLNNAVGLHPEILGALVPPTGSRDGGHGTKSGEISQQAAVAISGIDDQEDQKELWNTIKQADPALKVKDVRRLVDTAKTKDVKAAIAEAKNLLSKQKKSKAVEAAEKKQRDAAKKESQRLERETTKLRKKEEREAQKEERAKQKLNKKAEKKAARDRKKIARDREKAEAKERAAKDREERLHTSRLSIEEAWIAFGEILPFKAAQAAYREAARLLHPDQGGSAEQMSKLNSLWRVIERRYGK